MSFPSVTFAAFFLCVVAVHGLLIDRQRSWKIAMIAASAVFYGWWDWRFCGLIAASIAYNWSAARVVDACEGSVRRTAVGATVIVNLAVLGGFKYYNFFAEAVAASLGPSVPVPVIDVVLPIGISFFTFQALSYVVDVHRGEFAPRPLLDVAFYLSFFPQLVAGPIVRAGELLPQLDDRKASTPTPFEEAAWLIGRGLFKKMVIATYLAETVVDPVYAAPNVADRGELLLAFYGYAIQIYADFSGYTDIAIGLALLLGFRFPTNFDRPYGALSVQDFWRRWHMTLSRWLRDYVYIPLGGNRISRVATYRNLMATMVLGGLWHGAAWTFVVWGALHGATLSVERFVAARKPPSDAPTASHRALRWLVTFHIVAVAWVFFRAPTFGVAASMFTGLVSAPFERGVNPTAVALIAGALAVQLIPTDVGVAVRTRIGSAEPVLQSAFAGGWIAIVVALGPDGVAPFIYFQF
ncbi:MAG: MBOAT family O-acyltransferase [Acidimicrobiales bacterium]